MAGPQTPPAPPPAPAAAPRRRTRRDARTGSLAAAAASDVVAGQGLGQRDVGACVEPAHQLAPLVLQVALHREAAAGGRILVALSLVAEAVVEFGLAAVGQMREAAGDLHSGVG